MTEWVLSSSILILIVIALRTCVRGKISLRLQYAIWGLVLLRLLIPVNFGSTNISVVNLTVANEPPAIQSTITPNTQNTQHVPNNSPEDIEDEIKDRYESQGIDVEVHVDGPVNVSAILRDAAPIIWAVGFVSVAGLFLFTNARFKRKIMDSRYDLGLRKNNLDVYATGEIDTPCLFGIKNPAIYVTYPVADNQTLLRHTLEHEATHHRHGDHIWAVLRCVCLAIHWYNPLVWWAAFLSQRDAELACDEATIKRLGEGERAEYGRTLIGMTCQKKANVLITATTMNSGKSGLKERIMLIAKKPKMALYALLIVVLVASIAVGCTFTGAKSNDPIDENGDIIISTDPTEEITPAESTESTENVTEPPATEIPDDAPPVNIPEMFHEQPEDDKVCIAVQPTGLVYEGGAYLYIIPEDQATLLEYYQAATANRENYFMWDNDMQRAGWWIVYQGQWWQVTESGAMFGTDQETWDGITIDADDARKLYEFCDAAVKEAGIGEPVRPEKITGIISATLYWNGLHTISDPNYIKGARVITDPYALKRIESLFSNSRAESSAQCWMDARLELALQNGETLILVLATDSCATWMSEGVYYSFGEITNVGINGNEEFYSLFMTDIIHEKAQEGPDAMAEYWIYTNWRVYGNSHTIDETFALMDMFKAYAAANPTDWIVTTALTTCRGLDGAFAEYYASVVAALFEADPVTFSFACRQMIPEQDVENAVNMLAFYWNITPKEVKDRIEEARNQN